jgi:hypothetical protein
MKTLKFVKPELVTTEFRWPNDVTRIVNICANQGYIISRADAQAAWEEYSDGLAACWLMLDDSDNAVLTTVMEYCKAEG